MITVDVTQARLDLARALEAASAAPNAADRFRAARQVLISHGAAVPHIGPAVTAGLLDLVERAAHAPASPARRVFAVLLVDALAVPGLLSVRSSQARLDRGIRTLVENALPDVLLRAGYPFGGDADAKRRLLSRLHATIEDHMRPLEPSIPTWLSGRTEH
ncbi:MAG TPA: hypothetical protein VK741_10200 [Acetobacteraceae bacterium]|nr:hypothetical protein [Acetobacteraceae bacterium]